MGFKTAFVHCLIIQFGYADLFNYKNSDGNDYGPEDWSKVSCTDLDNCVSVIPSDTVNGIAS